MRGRWAAMVRLAYGLTGDQGHAEDVAQAAFARGLCVMVPSRADMSEAETAAALSFLFFLARVSEIPWLALIFSQMDA
jgi:hypothetical protein